MPPILAQLGWMKSTARLSISRAKSVGREHVLADRHRHAAGAHLRGGAEILRRPHRLLEPLELELAQRRRLHQGLLQDPGRVDVDHQAAAGLLPQQLRRHGDLGAPGLVHLEVFISAAQRLLGDARHHVGIAVLEQARIGRKLVALRTAEQLVDRQVRRLAEDVPQRHVEPGQRVHHRPGAADPVGVAHQPVHQRRDVGRIGADAGGRDQRLDQRFDGAPDPMRERLAPAGEAGVGLDLDQQGVEGGARLAGELELRRAGLDAAGDR